MWQSITDLLQNKKPDFENIIKYGFVKENNYYSYSQPILDNSFLFIVQISEQGMTAFKILDKSTNEEYSPAYVSGAVGKFVGTVRHECEKIFFDIVNHCYEQEIFKSIQAKAIIKYIEEKYQTEPEYLWEKFPNNAIFREKKSAKWFAALLTLDKQKLGFAEKGQTEIINLKELPENIAEMIDNKKYFPGFHMNKKHWYTICLDGSVSSEEIFQRIKTSYEIIFWRNSTKFLALSYYLVDK